MTSVAGASGEWARTVRALYLVAMAVFVVTVLIGIVNGLDLYEFSHDEILTHVHSGTLGWITLGLVASAAWLSRGIDRRLAITLAILIPIYVALFYLAIGSLRAISGVLVLVAILWLVVWAWRTASASRSLPALALALGFTTFTYGAIIGVLRQVQLAGGPNLFPPTADPIGAHASAMVFSYLILAAMGLLEWRLLTTADRPRGGVIQVVLLFVGGLVISGALLFLTADGQQAAAGLYLLLELVAVVVFVVRVVPRSLRVDWGTDVSGAHLAASALFVPVATAVFLIVIYRFIADPSLTQDPTPVIGILTASDHAAFIGVVTNLLFGLLFSLTADRRDRWPWADRLVLWGMNLGLVVFLVGLIASVTILKQIGAPVMGLSILLGMAVLGGRLWTSGLEVEPARS
ncbi:MAG TPA: hypothetical protein VH720_13580 [Candidatus Limnocylindrales bacterium]|jgi:hypothetical protein